MSESQKPPPIIRTYRGNEQSIAFQFKADADNLSKQGYLPTSEIWAPGSYGCVEFLFALVLCFVLIGFLIFIYMIIVKPPRSLTVTYEHRTPPEAQKTCPLCAETVKEAAKVCRFCGYLFEAETNPKTSTET